MLTGVLDRDNLANVYEAEKDHQLKDEKEGKAHWKQGSMFSLADISILSVA